MIDFLGIASTWIDSLWASCPSWIRASHIRLVLGLEKMTKLAHPEGDSKLPLQTGNS